MTSFVSTTGCGNSPPSEDVVDNKSHPFEKPLDSFRDEESEYDVLARATHFDSATVRQLAEVFNDISSSKVPLDT